MEQTGSAGQERSIRAEPLQHRRRPATPLNHDVAPDGSRFVAVFPWGVDEDGSLPDQIVIVQNWFEELRRLVPTN